MFTLKPNKSLHGKGLKRWYRRVSFALWGKQELPPYWTSRPSVRVSAKELIAVMETLYKVTIPIL